MVIPFIQVVSWLLAHNFIEPRTDQLIQPEIFNLWYQTTEVNSDSANGTSLFQHLHAISHSKIWEECPRAAALCRGRLNYV